MAGGPADPPSHLFSKKFHHQLSTSSEANHFPVNLICHTGIQFRLNVNGKETNLQPCTFSHFIGFKRPNFGRFMVSYWHSSRLFVSYWHCSRLFSPYFYIYIYVRNVPFLWGIYWITIGSTSSAHQGQWIQDLLTFSASSSWLSRFCRGLAIRTRFNAVA